MVLPAILAGIALAILIGFVAFRLVVARRRNNFRPLGAYRASASASRVADEPMRDGLVSEMNTLRIQVESLQADMSALRKGSRSDHPRWRPYRSGQYAHLSRPLRRQVREVRNFRHPVSV